MEKLRFLYTANNVREVSWGQVDWVRFAFVTVPSAINPWSHMGFQDFINDPGNMNMLEVWTFFSLIMGEWHTDSS